MFLDALFGTGVRTTTRSQKTRKPSVEPLEERDVPATLLLPQTDLPTFTATFNKSLPGGGSILVAGHPIAGGNFRGLLNGNVPLTASYCVNISLDIFPNTTYANAAVTSDGTIYGKAIPHAGEISWLLTHFGPTATTPEAQDALQAAIWRVEYGEGFQLDGVDNDNLAPAFNAKIAPIYQADLAALGHNTASVSAVAWISPGANPGLPPSQGQGLVALTGPPISQHSTTDNNTNTNNDSSNQPKPNPKPHHRRRHGKRANHGHRAAR